MSAPRDLDDIAADRRYAPAIMRTLADVQNRLTDPLLRPFEPQPPGPRHCIPVTEPESEVMPPETDSNDRRFPPDIRPPSATEANRDDFSNDPFPLNRLDEIAALVRLLTYGEMMDLAAALWKMRPEGKEVTEQELPGMFHGWSAKCQS